MPDGGGGGGRRQGGAAPRQPDPMQTAVGYIGADAFTRKAGGAAVAARAGHGGKAGRGGRGGSGGGRGEPAAIVPWAACQCPPG